VGNVEERLLAGILGEVTYTDLETKYRASLSTPFTALSASNAKLLDRCRKVVAPLALLQAARMSTLNHGDGGLTVAVGEDMEQAQKWKVDGYYDALHDEGFAAIEQLYLFLEKNKADYAAWVASDAYSEAFQFLINTATEFSRHVNINESRWTFKNFQPAMDMAEQLFILPAIGAAYYAELKARIKVPTQLTAFDKTVLPMLRKAVALMTVYIAAPDMALILNGNAISVLSDAASDTKKDKAISLAQLDKFRGEKRDMAERFVLQAKQYLDTNADSFPTYKSSSAYKPIDNYQPPGPAGYDVKGLCIF
jgi:hypothetical protein